MIEKNTIGITNDFSALKNRIQANNRNFRANFLNQAQFTVNQYSSGMIPGSATLDIPKPPGIKNQT